MRPITPVLVTPVLVAAVLSCALVSVAVAQVDHRASQSSVKNQGRRGTCVAFALAAALETFPGVPTDLSEQLLYATVKRHQNAVDLWLRQAGQAPAMTEGDSFGAYLPLFAFLGTCDEGFLPYHPDPVRVPPGTPDELRRYLQLAQITAADLSKLRDGYGKYGIDESHCQQLDAAAAQDVARIKRLLDGGTLAVPVSYILHGERWSDLPKFANHGGDPTQRTIVHPGMAEQFARRDGPWMSYNKAIVECMKRGEDLVDGVREGAWRTRMLDDAKAYSGHAVTICGYDGRGFLVKNSWGTAWGDGGYCTVAFDYHRLYARQAVALRRARIRMPVLSPFEQRRRITNGVFRLKVQPLGSGDDASLSFSTWQHAPRDANVEVVEYGIEVFVDDKWVRCLERAIPTGPIEQRIGAPMLLTGAGLKKVRTAQRVRVTVRYGDLPFGDASKPKQIRYLATRRYPAFAPTLAQATDFAPRG